MKNEENFDGLKKLLEALQEGINKSDNSQGFIHATIKLSDPTDIPGEDSCDCPDCQGMKDPDPYTQAKFIKEYVKFNLMPLFELKSTAYANDEDEFFTIRNIAKRQFREVYEEAPYEAMIKVCDVLVDKHNIAVANGPDTYEYEERLKDILVYTFFKLRLFKEMQTSYGNHSTGE